MCSNEVLEWAAAQAATQLDELRAKRCAHRTWTRTDMSTFMTHAHTHTRTQTHARARMSRHISTQLTRRVHELARGTQAKHSTRFDYGVCMCALCTFGCTLSTPYIVEYLEYPIVP